MSSSFFYCVVLDLLQIHFWAYLPVILLMCYGLVSMGRNRDKKQPCEALNSNAPQLHKAISSGNEPSVYDNLGIAGSQIRLLTITSTTPKITCQLEVADLQDRLAFHALSYVWGDSNVTETIFVNDHKVQVTTNLALALGYVPQHLNRSKNAATMKLWVDAICINQGHIAEKNHLQHATSVIYRAMQRVNGVIPTLKFCWTPLKRACRNVASWYGRFHTLTSKLGLSLIPHSRLLGSLIFLLSMRVHNLVQAWASLTYLVLSNCQESNIELLQECLWIYDIKVLVGEPPAGPIHSLFDLPYWRRIWIRQEIILAKRPVFASGARSISIETLACLACWVRSMSNLSPAACQGFFSKPKEVARFAWAYKRLQNLLYSIFEARNGVGVPVTPGFGVEYLDIPGAPSAFKPNAWWSSPDCHATDPKDHFYGFLGVTNLNLMPDYSGDKSVGLVCQEFMVEYLRESHDRSDRPPGGPLGPLMFAGHGHGWHSYPDMPSWGPNFPGQALSSPSSRGGADAIISPDPRGFGCVFKSEPDTKIADSELNISILVLDRVHDIGPRVSDYGRPELWHESGLPMTWAIDFGIRHKSYVSGGHPLTAFRFLLEIPNLYPGHRDDFPVGDCLEFATFLARFSRPAVHRKLSAVVRSRLFYPYNLLAQITDDMCPEEEQNYFTNLAATTKPYNHAIAETHKGYVGRFPPKIKEDDLICVLNGLDQVAVLRQVGKHYIFIGTCLVAGMAYSKQIQLLVDLYGLKAKDANLR